MKMPTKKERRRVNRVIETIYLALSVGDILLSAPLGAGTGSAITASGKARMPQDQGNFAAFDRQMGPRIRIQPKKPKAGRKLSVFQIVDGASVFLMSHLHPQY
jgi:hypothetical protein